MEYVYALFRFLLLLLAFFTVGSEIYQHRKDFSFIKKIWKRFRPKMFFEVFLLLFAVLSAIVLLNRSVPFLGIGWSDFFFSSGGNIIVAPIIGYSDSEYLGLRLIPPLFLVLLLFTVPYLANAEEKLFRKGYRTWGKMIRQSILFGLVHLIAGISLSVAIALIIPGLFLAYKYGEAYNRLAGHLGEKEANREAVLTSTAYHTLFNTILILYILALLLANL